MSLGLNKTKRRIASVKGTEKITNAMELIATVKAKRYLDAYEANRHFAEEYLSLMAEVFAHDKESVKSHYSRINKGNLPTLYIVISSNLGLCGAYNSSLLKFADKAIKPTDKVAPIGSKAKHHYANDPRLVHDCDDLDLDLDFTKISAVCAQLRGKFNEKEYKNICIIHTRYVNSIKFKPTIFQLLPVTVAPKKWPNEEYCPPLFDEPPRVLIHRFMREYLSTMFYQCLLESELSEQSSRRTAMNNANDNAEELLGKLTIEYNKARQNAITQEITEVVGGANAN